MSQPWRCLNECPRVGLVRGRRDRAGFPGRGDAPARTRVTRLRVGKLLARSQSRQTDCPRFSRHTRWPPGTDPSPRETQTTPATTIHSPRETQTTPAPRKTLKYTDNQPAGAVPVTSPPPTPHAGAVPVTSGNLTTSSTHRSDTPVKPRPPQLREKPSNTPKTPRRGGPGYITTTNTPRRGGPGYTNPSTAFRRGGPGYTNPDITPPAGAQRSQPRAARSVGPGIDWVRPALVSAARRQVRRPRHRLGAPRACLSRAQPGPSPGRRRARRGRGGSARR